MLFDTVLQSFGAAQCKLIKRGIQTSPCRTRRVETEDILFLLHFQSFIGYFVCRRFSSSKALGNLIMLSLPVLENCYVEETANDLEDFHRCFTSRLAIAMTAWNHRFNADVRFWHKADIA